VSGLYNGTADSTYTVIISRINKGDNCTLGSQLPRCFETNEFQWYVLYLLNYFCILMIVIKIVETFLNAYYIIFRICCYRCSNVGGGAECNVFQAGRNITGGMSYLLSNGVSVSFASSVGHYPNDKWRFSAVRCANPIPSGSSIKVALERSGSPILNQITVAPGFAGPAYGLAVAYKKAPVFIVQNQNVEVFTLMAGPPPSGQTSNNFRLSINDTLFAQGKVLSNDTTVCLSWDSEDKVVEAALTR
jgi:hypothetical protein